MTALPIVETQAGDYAAYIPTNVISITDGQIYLEKNLFNAGIRPAVHVGLSVSRVGGNAQIKAMKKVAGALRLELAQYRELASFAKFGTELDKATQAQLNKGEILVEILKQGQYKPMPVEYQVIIIWMASNGFLDNIDKIRLKDFEEQFLQFVKERHPQIIEDLHNEKQLSEAIIDSLTNIAKEFSSKFQG